MGALILWQIFLFLSIAFSVKVAHIHLIFFFFAGGEWSAYANMQTCKPTLLVINYAKLLKWLPNALKEKMRYTNIQFRKKWKSSVPVQMVRSFKVSHLMRKWHWGRRQYSEWKNLLILARTKISSATRRITAVIPFLPLLEVPASRSTDLEKDLVVPEKCEGSRLQFITHFEKASIHAHISAIC